MIKTSLPLRRVSATERAHAYDKAAKAWVIHSPISRVWVEVIIALGLPQEKVKIFPRMVDGADLALVFSPQSSVIHVAKATPLHELLGEVWIPYDASPSIPISEEDREHLIVADSVVVLPNNNSVHLDHANALGLADLLQAPDLSGDLWNAAVAAEPSQMDIRSIHTPQPPSLESYLEEAKGDIGTEPIVDLKDKQLAKELFPDKPSPLKKAAGVGAGIGLFPIIKLLGMASAISKFGRNSGRAADNGSIQDTGKGGSFLEGLERWVMEQLEHLQKKQDSETKRLLELFKNRPDEALKYAIPLSDDAGRGLESPGGTLDQRKVQFNMSHIGSGGNFSPWDIDNDTYSSLIEAYREAANREIALGNFDKAAYIYANLLNDWRSAAKVLEKAERFYEAALLYQKVHDKREEARCYLLAGDFEKALELYHELRDLEKVAEVLEQLGRKEEAEQVWRDEIQRLLDQGAIVDAARLQMVKFHEIEQVIALLEEHWPKHRASLVCLQEELKMRLKYQDSDTLLNRVKNVVTSDIGGNTYHSVLEIFAKLHHEIRDKSILRELEDQIRVLTSLGIKQHAVGIQSSMMKVMKSVSMGDEVLIRDIEKFIREIPRPKIGATPKRENATKLSGIQEIGSAIPTPGQNFHAVARFGDLLLIVEGHKFFSIGLYIPPCFDRKKEPNILKEIQRKSLANVERKRNFNLSCSSLRNSIASNIDFSNTVDFEYRDSFQSEQFLQNNVRVSSLGPNAFASCIAPDGRIIRLVATDLTEIFLQYSNASGELISSIHLAALPPNALRDGILDPLKMQSSLVATGKKVYIALGETFGVYCPQSGMEWEFIDEEIVGLSATAQGAARRVLISTRSKLSCLWEDLGTQKMASASVKNHIKSIFLVSGYIVSLVDFGRSVEIRKTDGLGKLTTPEKFSPASLQLISRDLQALDIVPNDRNSFIVMFPDMLRVFRIME